MAGPSPLLGYNTNVRHNGKLYHIQTEDSGVRRPHVITHLFADGGRIIASKKTSYRDLVESGSYREQVKQLMREQHKAMFIGLRDGDFDDESEPKIEVGEAKAPVAPPASDESSLGMLRSLEATAERLADSPAESSKTSAARYEATEPVREPKEAVAADRNRKSADSIFGDGLLSEKSLDEVILSYLAEDLDDDG